MQLKMTLFSMVDRRLSSTLGVLAVFLGILTSCEPIPVYAQFVVAPTTAECATSIDGSVVGTINPLSPPILTTSFTGSLSAGNYFVEEAWLDSFGHTTLVSPETPVQLTGTGELIENIPSSGIPATVVTRKIYIGTTSGSETLQGSASGSTAYTQSVPLVTGAAVPTLNNTVCQVVANDAGWPTGTGYLVSLTTPSGETAPGYPLQAQFLGPGNNINLGQGFPQYNGTVLYPIPIMARPYNHGPQSISGNLTLGPYALSANTMTLGTSVTNPSGGTNVVYRCVTAGSTLPIGSLTINAAACGSTQDTGLRVP
jgi:hypothetical protein